jgi:hypothetical protein
MDLIEKRPALENQFLAKKGGNIIQDEREIVIFFDDRRPKAVLCGYNRYQVFQFFLIY